MRIICYYMMNVIFEIKREVLFLAGNNKKDNQKVKNNYGIQITPPDSNEKEKVEMCILCEKKPAYKTATVDSDLCKSCREGFIRTPFRLSGIIALVLVIIMAVSGILVVRPQTPTVSAIRNGYKSLSESKYSDAIGGISDLATQGTMGWKTAFTLAKFCKKINLPTDYTFLVEQFFYDKEANPDLTWQDMAGKANLNASWNKDIKEYYDYLVLLEKLADEKSKHFTDYYSQLQSGSIESKDIPYDDIINRYKAELKTASSDAEKGMIYYYLLATSSICEKDIQTQLDYCKSVAQYLPGCYWLYLDNLITLSIQAGEYSEATKHIETLSKSNETDANYARRYTAMLYRYQGKYDESLAILKDLIANIDATEIYEAYFEAMLCEMLKGNTKEALEYAIYCVEYEYYLTYDSINLYAILCKQAGDDEGYKFACEIFEQYGMELSPTVDKYLNGEITMEELFKDGEVVFE